MSNKYDYVPKNPDRYDLEAVRIIDAFRESDAVSISALYPIIGKALRNAANEAAWDGVDYGYNLMAEELEHGIIAGEEILSKMRAKYGPKTGGTR